MKFGTSGLRGLVAEMTDPVCAAYVAAFLAHLRRQGEAVGEVLVGRDLRPSSPRIAAACLGAVRGAGAVAVDCGVVPTPALALEAARRGAPAVMVTGSHIPFDRNGLKFYRTSGEITKADEAGIVAALGPAKADGVALAAVDEGRAVGARYVARYVGFFGPGCLAGCRVGVQEHSAAGRELIGEILGELGAEVVRLGRTEVFVPIDTEAVAAEHAQEIAAWVAEHRLDALVSTDGDGDRPLVADEAGRVVRGDTLGVLTARFLGADAVATPQSSGTALELCGWFPKVVRTRIGSPYVIEAIERLATGGARLPVGYEANGGFLLGGTATRPDGRSLPALPTRDAMTPILAVLAAALGEGRSLSDLVAALPRRITASDRLQEVPESSSRPLLAALAGDPAARADLLGTAAEGATVDTLDGVRLTLASGEIVHVRMSGNAPELRCYCEAADSDRAEWLLRETLARLARRLEAGTD